MVIIQSILALITRSLGNILSALFGWAVIALFGPADPREKIWLSALVASAAAWPLLLLGAIWPRLAAFVLAFVPIPPWVPAWGIRLAWIALAIIVPFVLGVVMAARSRGVAAPIPGTRRRKASHETSARHSPIRESRVVRLFRGIPMTLAVAASFCIVFVSVPLRRLSGIVRRQVDLDVPLVTDADGYEQVAQEVADTLGRHGFEVRPVRPPWTVTAPSRILARMGGASFRDYVPKRFAAFRGPKLEVLLFPNGLRLRGSEQDTAWAHGLLVETLTDAPAYQTFDPKAQDIERQIRSVWAVFRDNPEAHAGARALRSRLDEIAEEIRDLPVDYDEWQIVYRQTLQLDRVLLGRPQLLEATATSEGSPSNGKEGAFMTTPSPSRTMSTRDLVGEITEKVALLARKEVELARTEIRADLKSEIATAKGLGVAAVVVLLGLNTLVVAVVLALAPYIAGWLAAVIVGGVLLLVGGIVGWVSWSRRVTAPLEVTRKTLKEAAQWAKERLA